MFTKGYIGHTLIYSAVKPRISVRFWMDMNVHPPNLKGPRMVEKSAAQATTVAVAQVGDFTCFESWCSSPRTMSIQGFIMVYWSSKMAKWSTLWFLLWFIDPYLFLWTPKSSKMATPGTWDRLGKRRSRSFCNWSLRGALRIASVKPRFFNLGTWWIRMGPAKCTYK